MGLEDKSQVDILAKPPNGGLELVLIDDGEITDEERRYQLIVEKLASYADFVLSGQYLRHSPEVRIENIRIRVISRTPPNEKMLGIVSVGSPDHADARIPVVVEQEKAARLRLAAEAARPWWKFW